MADKSITNGANGAVADAVSMAAGSPTSAPKGKRSTGGGSRASKKSAAPKKPKQDKVTLTANDRIMIFQSSILELSSTLNQPIDIAQGTGETFLIRLPRKVGVCHHVDPEPEGHCLRLFLQPDPAQPQLYCDQHLAAHSTAPEPSLESTLTEAQWRADTLAEDRA